MITVATAKSPVTKSYRIDTAGLGMKPPLDTIQPKPVKAWNLTVVDPQTPQELEDIFRHLKANQAIISGVHHANKTYTENRTKDAFVFKAPWLPFDRDYITDEAIEAKYGSYVEMLAAVDPQLGEVQGLLKNSASNIIDTKTQYKYSPHRQKFWVQFHPKNTYEDIIRYKDILFKRAIALGFHKAFISDSPNAYPTVLHRTMFDTAAFQTQALSYEAVPLFPDSNDSGAQTVNDSEAKNTLQHNTVYIHTKGIRYVDATNIAPLTDLEEITYTQRVNAAKVALAPDIAKKLVQLKRDNPAQDWDSISNEILSEDAYLITPMPARLSEAERKAIRAEHPHILKDFPNSMVLKVSRITEHIVKRNYRQLIQLRHRTFRDPLDPAYGEDKAKIFVNHTHINTAELSDNELLQALEASEIPPSLVLHSFAHGSHVFKILPSVTHIPAYLNAVKKPYQRKSIEVHDFVSKIAPMFVAKDADELQVTAAALSKLATTAIVKNTLTAKAQTPKKVRKEAIREDHPLAAYSLWVGNNTPLITYDPDMGIKYLARSGAEAYLANADPILSGAELLKDWLEDPTRNDVTQFGLYPPNTPKKLNMWMGFKARLQPVAELTMIEPFIEFLHLLTDTEYTTNSASSKVSPDVHYLLQWLADIVQHPMRSHDVRSMVILESPEQGTGKTTFSELIGSFFHPSNILTVSRLSSVIGRFNTRLAPVVFMTINEFTNDSGLSQTAVTNLIKGLVDSNTIEIEAKGVDSSLMPNRLHILVTTNHPFRFVDPNDRRATVFRVSPAWRGQQHKFKELRMWWNTGYKTSEEANASREQKQQSGRDLVFTYLANMAYDLNVVTKSYESTATLQHRVAMLDPLDTFLFRMCTEALDNLMPSVDTHIIRVFKKDFHGEYSVFMEAESDKKPISQYKLMQYLNTFDGVEIDTHVTIDVEVFKRAFADARLNTLNMRVFNI